MPSANPYMGWLGSTLKDGAVSFDDLFFPILTHWLALPFAVFCLLQYFRRNKDIDGDVGRAGSQSLRTLGKEIIILQIYYSPHFGAVYEGQHGHASKYAFVASCLYLCLEETILYGVVEPKVVEILEPMSNGLTGWLFAQVTSCWGLPQQNEPLLHQALLPTGKEARAELSQEQSRRLIACDDNTVYNIYMDVRKSLRKAIITFLAQAGLFLYYVYELNGAGGSDDPGVQSHDPRNCSVAKWCFAVAVIVVAGEDEIGPPFSYDYWSKQLRCVVKAILDEPAMKRIMEDMGANLDPESNNLLLEALRVGRLAPHFLLRKPRGTRRDTVMRLRIPPLTHLLLRAALDFFVNAFARCIIRGTAPIMLCVEGPLDFVKDVTAVFFIIKLDDIDRDADLTNANSWNVTVVDSGYDFDSWTDPIYDVNGLRGVLGFPTDREMVKLLKEGMGEKVVETES